MRIRARNRRRGTLASRADEFGLNPGVFPTATAQAWLAAISLS